MPRIPARPGEAPPVPASGGRVLPWRCPETTDVDRAVDLVLAGLRPRIEAAAREWAAAPFLLAELLRHPPARREVLARNSGRFRNLPLCGLLIERSLEESSAVPGRGERLAALALSIVESLDADWYGEWALADARARCWMLIGNARRMAADREGAERAFRSAERYLRRGTGHAGEKDRLLAYKAGLRRAQR
jgi:hypothetical protein